VKPKKRGKSRLVQLAEFLPVYWAFAVARRLSPAAGHRVSRVLGNLVYYAVGERRRIALENLRAVYGTAKSEDDLRALARESCYSFVAALFEAAKFASLQADPAALERLRQDHPELEALFSRVKAIHEQSGGCIFVTPHIGDWEFLPYVGFHAGIPLVIVVRPLDNPLLEKFLYSYRQKSGQLIVPKTNSMMLLQNALRHGKSVGLLPDQSTMRAISVDYLGRKATTTPVPAILAALYRRPIVVVACCRGSEEFRFDGFVSDPIWPERDRYDKAEIFRLTQEMNRVMGDVVLKYPEQYFWMHNRWKTYQSKDDLSL
jgi:KDO2-lipid IV(A) lauroyltransferase